MKSMKIDQAAASSQQPPRIEQKIFLNLYVPILIYKKHRGFSNMRERIFLNHKKILFTLRGPKKEHQIRLSNCITSNKNTKN